jgi:hypothetical protein
MNIRQNFRPVFHQSQFLDGISNFSRVVGPSEIEKDAINKLQRRY